MITVPSEPFHNCTMYGTIKFSISLQDLVDTYIDSIAPCQRVTSSIRKQVHYDMEQNPVMLLLPSPVLNITRLIKQPFINLSGKGLPPEDITTT